MKKRKCGAIAVVEDVTEWRRNEQALRDSERMLRLAQKTANAGAYEWDIRKNRVQWSADFARLIGKAEDVVPSFNVWVSVVHPDDPPMPHRSSVRSHRENGIPYRYNTGSFTPILACGGWRAPAS